MNNNFEKKQICIIVPVFNEAKIIPLFYEEIKKVIDTLDYDFEIMFISDGSKDNSFQVLNDLAGHDERVKIIEFTRNFGKEVATTAGLNFCHSDAAIVVDGDMQHPLELIPEFIKKWEQGYDVVVGVRNPSKKQKLFNRIFSALFYKLINLISQTEIVHRATDYRLVDSQVIREFNRMTERNRMTRGLIDWLGFKREYIYFDVNERAEGDAKYSLTKLSKLAVDSIVSLSLFPLKLAGYLGIFITIFAGMFGTFIFVEKYVLNDIFNMNFSGPAQLAVMILFLVGIILICLGLIALYIANIHIEVINRPLYVIRKSNIKYSIKEE